MLKQQLSVAKDPETAYFSLVDADRVMEDRAQIEVLEYLQRLHEQLLEESAPKSPLTLLTGKRKNALAGIYIWGSVGRGKSMLMDLFFQTAPVKKKRRIHFHSFMQEIHARLHQIRQTRGRKGGDPVQLLLKDLTQEVELLCFDELQATDVADASLLHRLFEGLFEANVTIVSTSNHPPETLYTGGVQRERFNKLINLLKAKMQVVSLTSPTDYRTQQLKALTKVFCYPLGKDADRFVDQVVANMAPHLHPAPYTFHIQGRDLVVQSYSESIGRADFTELCGRAHGVADYLVLAEQYDVFILTNIPCLTPEQRNEAKRFVLLVDTFYEHKVKLICTADCPPDKLYPEGDGSFEFRRTVSRLMEMQSAAYLGEKHV